MQQRVIERGMSVFTPLHLTLTKDLFKMSVSTYTEVKFIILYCTLHGPANAILLLLLCLPILHSIAVYLYFGDIMFPLSIPRPLFLPPSYIYPIIIILSYIHV